MGVHVEIPTETGHMQSLNLAIPEQCPFCNHHIAPILQYASYTHSDNHEKSKVVGYWACNSCANVFAAYYHLHMPYSMMTLHGELDGTCPPLLSLTDVAPSIQETFPYFTEILRQAEIAKAHELTDIAGMGFRKALECLLKDALVYLGRKSRTEVENLKLAACIEAFSDHPELEKAANRIRDIGNDYTHYKAKYEGYDLDQLQELIRLCLPLLSTQLILAKPLTLRETPHSSRRNRRKG